MADQAPWTETQIIESTATVVTVVELFANPTRIPEWAPAFADRVSGDVRSGWEATKDGRNFPLRVAVDRGSGTVDYLRHVTPDREGGAYIRGVPRPGDGSVITMTLPLLADVDAADTSGTLARELTPLVSLVEST